MTATTLGVLLSATLVTACVQTWRLRRLERRLLVLGALTRSLAVRVAAQSELLSKRAEAKR